MRIPITTSVVLVVDVQNDFCELDFACHRSGRDLAPIRTMVQRRLLPFLQRARQAGVRIIYVVAYYAKGKFSADGFPELCVEGTPGAELFLLQVDPQSAIERIIFKTEFDAFTNPELHRFLQEQRVHQVLVTGVATDKCVRATVCGAQNHGYHTVLVEDLVAAGKHRDREHQEVLAFFRTQVGIEVVSSSEIEF